MEVFREHLPHCIYSITIYNFNPVILGNEVSHTLVNDLITLVIPYWSMTLVNDLITLVIPWSMLTFVIPWSMIS